MGISSEADFYRADPTPLAAWRWAVLMGANTRTYKFALGSVLLDRAAEGRDAVPLTELAAPYAMSIVRHVKDAPQARQGTSAGETDFLTVAAAEAEESLRTGEPTDRLVQEAAKSMLGMVMVKFHNIRGGGEIPHRFYEIERNGRDRIVRLSPELRRIAASEQLAELHDELDGRWSIVETSFTTGVGRSLMEQGLAADLENFMLVDKLRRRPVTGVKEALIGFQHGRCMICHTPIGAEDRVAIDHVFPFALMKNYRINGVWPGPDLDRVWNLAPAHEPCNGSKNDRPPTSLELERLAQRNEAIMFSPHPLSRTLRLTLDNGPFTGPRGWSEFIRAVQDIIV